MQRITEFRFGSSRRPYVTRSGILTIDNMRSAIKQVAHKLNFYRYRFKDTLEGRYDDDFNTVDGYYRIDIDMDGCEPFWYPLHVGKSHRRDRINGKHEQKVFQRR